MLNEEEVLLLINQAELHLRNARTEINEAGLVMYRIKRAF